MKIKRFVVFSLAMVLLFAIGEFTAGFFGVTHDTLTTCFFATFGGELLFTCVLKIFEKQDKGSGNNEQ